MSSAIVVSLTIPEAWDALNALVAQRESLQRIADRLNGIRPGAAGEEVVAAIARLHVSEWKLRVALDIPEPIVTVSAVIDWAPGELSEAYGR
jgi:hypothetical protein